MSKCSTDVDFDASYRKHQRIVNCAPSVDTKIRNKLSRIRGRSHPISAKIEPMSDLRTLTKIAVLYYRDNLTHEEIASRLGISRQTVGRQIERCRKEGLITIQIKSPLLFATELETELEHQFGLKEAIVVTPATEGDDATKDALGMAGAEFIQRHVCPGDTLGVAWGSTVLAVARQVRPKPCKNLTVVQLNGSMDVGSYSTRAEYMIGLFAEALGARMVAMSAPMLVDRREIVQSLLSDSRIASTLAVARRTNIALFGVGDLSTSSSPYRAGYYDQKLLDRARQDGAVGEICGRFYDESGQPCSPRLAERTLAIELETLREKPLSIAISGGPQKTMAMLGMLKGGFCNTLITDETTAKALIAARAPRKGVRGTAKTRD
jgi:deoxyribonucleoside regulator